MAVVSVNEIHSGRRADFTDQTAAFYTRIFRVVTDSFLDGMATVKKSPDLPAIYSSYSEPNGTVDVEAVCVRVTPEQSPDDPRVWVVRCDYTTDVTADPTLQPPDYSYTIEEVPFAVRWFVGNATNAQSGAIIVMPQAMILPNGDQALSIVNAAGDPYDPPPVINLKRFVLTITRNESTFARTTYAKYVNTTNKDVFYGEKAGNCFMDSITGEYVNPPNSPFAYWRVRYVVKFLPTSGPQLDWQLTILNAGYRFNNAGTPQLIRDPVDGMPFAKPTLLDAAGAVLPHGSAPIYIKYPVFDTSTFGDLNLPSAP